MTVVDTDGETVCAPCLLDRRLKLGDSLPGTSLLLWARLCHPGEPVGDTVTRLTGMPDGLVRTLVRVAQAHPRIADVFLADRYDDVTAAWNALTPGRQADAVRLAHGWRLPIAALLDTVRRLH